MIVECDRVSKSYGNLLALDSANIHIPEGVVFALLGPNGAGKTTLIKILAGLLARDKGNVTVLGMDPANNREKIADKTGILLENATVYPHMTGRRYLTYFAKLFHPHESSQEVDNEVRECLQTVGLAGASGTEAGKYSHGMKKRLLFARALINDPELIILDEPLAGLDPLVAHRLKEKIIQLNKDGRTVLFSTHILPDAEELSSHIAILNEGRVLVQDTLQALRQTYPSNRYRIAARTVDEGLVKTFQDMSFVTEVHVESEETLLIDVKETEIQNARQLIAENSPGSVLSATLVPLSLNQVFLRLVQGSGRTRPVETGPGEPH